MAVSPEEVLQGLTDIAGMLGALLQTSQSQQTLVSEKLQHMHVHQDRGVGDGHGRGPAHKITKAESSLWLARVNLKRNLEWKAKIISNIDKRSGIWICWTERKRTSQTSLLSLGPQREAPVVQDFACVVKLDSSRCVVSLAHFTPSTRWTVEADSQPCVGSCATTASPTMIEDLDSDILKLGPDRKC